MIVLLRSSSLLFNRSSLIFLMCLETSSHLKFGFKSVVGYLFFFLQIYNKVRTGEKVKVEHVVSVLEKKYPYVEVNSILGIDSAYDQNRKVTILQNLVPWYFDVTAAADCLGLDGVCSGVLIKVLSTQHFKMQTDPFQFPRPPGSECAALGLALSSQRSAVSTL